jgi:hypothetical protein
VYGKRDTVRKKGSGSGGGGGVGESEKKKKVVALFAKKVAQISISSLRVLPYIHN